MTVENIYHKIPTQTNKSINTKRVTSSPMIKIIVKRFFSLIFNNADIPKQKLQDQMSV